MAGRQTDRLSRSLDILHSWVGRVNRLTNRPYRSLDILHGRAGSVDGRTDRLYRSLDILHRLAERVDGRMDRLCNSASRYYVPERERGDRAGRSNGQCPKNTSGNQSWESRGV